MAQLTITELSQRTGLAPSALRFYERCGLLEPVGRAGGKRIYQEEVVQQIALVDLLKISGFTLAEIAVLIDRHGRVSPDWRVRARAKQDELRNRQADLDRALTMLAHTLECPHESLHECPVHRQVVAAHAGSLGGR